jgi:drug/metabolite transporter (DMT)-like permease
MTSQFLPLDLLVVLSGVALVIVVLAAYGRKFNKASAVIAVVGFVGALMFLLAEGLGDFGGPQSPGFGAMVASDWVSIKRLRFATCSALVTKDSAT